MIFEEAWSYLTTISHWFGPSGIGMRLAQHMWYSLLTIAIAAIIAIPLGLMIGHFKRGEIFLVGLVNAMRSLPTLGLLTFFVLLLGIGLRGPLLALVLLAFPPLLAGTYAGVMNVNDSMVDAAKAMGMSGWQLLTRVEIPNAFPLILGGLRNTALQVIATATVAAYVNLGGLGRYIFDGLSVSQYSQVLVGALLVAVLAIVVDGLLAVIVRFSIPGGHLREKSPIAR